MRRKDREMSPEFGLGVIDRAQFGVLSYLDPEGSVYSVPLSIARIDQKLYFHSAKSGRKVESFRDGLPVCVVFAADVAVPQLFTPEELDDLGRDRANASRLTSRAFTTEYASAIVNGRLHRVQEAELWREALRAICRKYTPHAMKHFDMAADSGKSATGIYEISIDELTAKRLKFDASGEELKWGRLT